VESALLPGASGERRPAGPGDQTIRLVFDSSQQLRRIMLVFEDHRFERSEGFVLRWSSDGGQSFKEIVRQQWNFSSAAATEREDYLVDLRHVMVLEPQIIPDRTGGTDVRASLEEMRLA
jgi:hypothetical protein